MFAFGWLRRLLDNIARLINSKFCWIFCDRNQSRSSEFRVYQLYELLLQRRHLIGYYNTVLGQWPLWGFLLGWILFLPRLDTIFYWFWSLFIVGYQMLCGNFYADNYCAISIGIICELVVYCRSLFMIKHYGEYCTNRLFPAGLSP